jgi:hypothetical protein
VRGYIHAIGSLDASGRKQGMREEIRDGTDSDGMHRFR